MAIKGTSVYDEYGQPWRLWEGDALFQEAIDAGSETSKIVWPLAKITEDRGWGWWSVFHKLDEFEIELEKQIVNPMKIRLIDITREYTPVELEDMLQAFSSYLSTIDAIEGRYEAQCHALKQGLATGLDVAMTRIDDKGVTITDRKASLLATQPVFADARKMQIEQEAMLQIIHGWRKAFEDAYAGVSRIISLRIGEASFTPARAQ